MNIKELAMNARKASPYIASLSSQTKNAALKAISEALQARAEEIITANNQDIDQAKAENLAAPLVKRLLFNRSKINSVCTGINSLIGLDDPIGEKQMITELDDSLILSKISCPIGVIGVIFESRPDALVQISTLCLKSGNAVLLKGGREAMRTNTILTSIIKEATEKKGIPQDWIELLQTRTEVKNMLALDKYIDLIIPRGSNDFVRYIMQNTTIAVLGHADGICHVYVHQSAQLDQALKICIDAKCQYVAVCNAAETILIDRTIAADFLPRLKEKFDSFPVTIRGCAQTAAIIPCEPATESDWSEEYLDYIVSIKIVDNCDQAITHINTYGSGHTDAIVATDPKTMQAFTSLVDSGNVFTNCSTRFSDGYRYGLGAEVGISTNKIHARGPVGLEGLCIYKWHLSGQGHITADYAGEKGKQFTHKRVK